MEKGNLARLIEQAEMYAKYARPPLHSFLVLHRGNIAAELYWWGYSPTSYQPVFSVTKSVVSALVGLALNEGKLTLSDTLAQWFPELPIDSRAASITIHHLLTMTSGFAPLKENIKASDPLGVLLCRPVLVPPGEQFRYENEVLDLLVALIERAVGEPTLDYAYRRLFTPLRIWQDVPKSSRKRLWKTDSQQRIKGGYGLHLTAREMAAFGQLYLQGGVWQGESLLSASFVSASTTAQSCGGHPEFVKYGYLWWVSTDSNSRPAFFAGGRGGQYIYVVPALDLIVVTTSTSQNADGRSHRVMMARLATQFIEGN